MIRQKHKLNNDTEPDIVYLANGQSILHDIPTYPDNNDEGVVNMIVEIPRGTNRKMETLVGKFDKTLLDKKEEKTPEKNNPEKNTKKFENRYFKYLNDQLGKCNPIIQDYKEGNLEQYQHYIMKNKLMIF